MQTTNNRSKVVTLCGNSSSSALDELRELSGQDVSAGWSATSNFPTEISDVVREKGCLCIILPDSWAGDSSRLTSPGWHDINLIEHAFQQQSTFVVLGDDQIYLRICRRLNRFYELDEQFPVLFIRPNDWHLVVHPWNKIDDAGGFSCQMYCALNFRYDRWLYEEFGDKVPKDLPDEVPDTATVPRVVFRDPRLDGWKRVSCDLP
ncbi:hypothetical protein [Paraburkholderia graminis]|uniref:hypothetical protein n=1 Tax=Paraburkholderia graminis TaxID=60548 RepID=UPI0031E213A0